ncbi:MAG: endonuclease domain-containing protein [Gammaproteobacteria bacterium]|nr:endonuclease domain-containing protein [Gammaproteobacteria bacterium]
MPKVHPFIPLAKALRKHQTDAEKLLWMMLRNRQLNHAKFKRQYAIGNYIVDFICIEKKLVIEIDGGQHIEQQPYDEVRTTHLNKQGFHVLRFWNNEVLLMVEAVLEQIRKHL